MDVQLQELIDKIKKDGVTAAEKSASEIITKSEAEAAKIIADAKAEAAEILKKADEEIARKEKASEEAVKQASRNLIISFREGITSELTAIINAEADKAFSSDLLVKLIPEVIKEWVKNTEASDVSVLLSEKDLASVEKGLTAALKAEISKGLTVKADKGVSNGFRVGVNNGQAFYDFSAESVAELFAAYLNPKVAALMKEAAK